MASPSSAPGSADRLPEGTRVGEYRIDRLVGEGGMGAVYAATHEALNRPAAIKFLHREFTSNRDLVTRFLQEAKAVNLVSHDNIVDIYDYGERGDGSVYFVMEFLEGEDLTHLLAREKPLPLPVLVPIFKQIMRALSAAHGKQVVHRDLKPDNVFLTRREDNPRFVKLLDFGIAKLRGAGAAVGLTQAGTLMGTPQFMSPEQAQGQPVDARSDIFSLGVMLYYAATGRLPFEGSDMKTVITKVVTEEPESPREAMVDGSELPPALESMILRALRKEPARRYESIDEMLSELRGIEAELAASPDARVASRPDSSSGGRWKLAATAGAAVAAAAVVVFVLLGRGDRATDAAQPAAAQATPGPTAEPTATPLRALVGAGKLADARKLARQQLEAALTGDRSGQADAIAALTLVRTPAAAPLLYRALQGGPQLRVDAARALRDLGLPDAAPKVRDALGQSGGKLRVDLAASLMSLGDDSAAPILEQALTGDADDQLTAAEALARAGSDSPKVRTVLRAIVDQGPPGRDRWRRAAVGLARLGDESARSALGKELALPHAGRAVAAAELLAGMGDDAAIAYLERVAADPEFAARGPAALALARAGRVRALEPVAGWLAGDDADDRRHAIAIAAILAGAGGSQHAAAIADLTDAADRQVRAAALAALLAF